MSAAAVFTLAKVAEGVVLVSNILTAAAAGVQSAQLGATLIRQMLDTGRTPTADEWATLLGDIDTASDRIQRAGRPAAGDRQGA